MYKVDFILKYLKELYQGLNIIGDANAKRN